MYICMYIDVYAENIKNILEQVGHVVKQREKDFSTGMKEFVLFFNARHKQ